MAISPSDWQHLQLDETVGALARNGILRIERTSAAILLIPSHYVGVMRAPNVTLTVHPKDDALHGAMLGLAIRFQGREAHHFESTSLGGDGDDLATAYLQALSRCVEDGLPWLYEQQTEATSRPRGKIIFARTLAAFVSRGVSHKVVSGRNERRQIGPFVDAVWAAYRSLSEAPGATPTHIQTAAILIEAFEPPNEMFVPDVILQAEQLLARNELPTVSSRELVAASLNLLDRERRSGNLAIALPSGTARFTDLERVWELAVAILIEDAMTAAGSSVTIHGLSDSGMKLFGNSGPTINPDVVVRDESGVIRMLADAKYKVLGGKEPGGIASDVYQLTCYVDRAGAGSGFLVYVGLTDSLVILGQTQTGARIGTIRLSADSLVSYGHGALTRLLTGENVAFQNA